MSDASPGSIVVRTANGDFETIENVADVAELVSGTLKVVFEDTTEETVSGSLFGGWGAWKLWLDPPAGDGLQKYIGEDPLTMPNDSIRFRIDEGTLHRAARIKRLKQATL
ncbi:hypothetical protein [Halonotius roseus]|uniref:Uncharacterized protein n=1 Tax=Halonotius roseus TaxID=2511997 RepID=A0A544QR39_9EURY|nr:hypothetical protein [Halonotius roseus]TQQ81897.1 hypothetical protein EWF95_02865 [Halonotius roseus]